MKGLPHSEHLDVVRHSLAHVMADAVVKVFAGTKVAIGPAIENGFYYDFQFPEGCLWINFSVYNGKENLWCRKNAEKVGLEIWFCIA